MFFVLGIDAATWTVVRPNLDRLPAFRCLCERGECEDLVLKETPVSPSVWCSMFSGKKPGEHGHGSFVVDGKIVKREDIKVDFVWDVLAREGKRTAALNVPFVVPPYSFGVDFKPVGFGLPTNEKEWQEELDRVSAKIGELLAGDLDLLVSCYTLLDRVQHFHWGEECVLDWYRRVDEKIGELLFGTGFVDDPGNHLIVISDHGFCSFGDAKIQTLPQRTAEGTLKGDHHENALLIRWNTDHTITEPQDVFRAVLRSLR